MLSTEACLFLFFMFFAPELERKRQKKHCSNKKKKRWKEKLLCLIWFQGFIIPVLLKQMIYYSDEVEQGCPQLKAMENGNK